MCRKLTFVFQFLTRQTICTCNLLHCVHLYLACLCTNASVSPFHDETMMIRTMTLACQLNTILSNSRRHADRTCRRGNSRTLLNVLIHVSNVVLVNICREHTHPHTNTHTRIAFYLCENRCRRTVHSIVNGKRWNAFIN